MADPTINFPKSYWTDANLSRLWYFVKYALSYNQKLVLIIVAIFTAGMVAVMVIDIFAKAREKDKHDDEDFDF
ncbi:hypothetical protein NSQ91_31855 [Paenibacillus sp. FSL R7-0048]|jgi:hypothetical protein|uniref:hypothetical protein n=1 Tax=unclassified Paenibacillus TaxID=185978 RepID=UPI0030FCD2B3